MKPLPQYPKYSITDDGLTVINNETGRTLKQATDKVCYIWVTLLLTDGEYTVKRIAVHRLVAYTYLSVPDANKVWVNHKDGNKHNNHYTNLEWTTISENIQHAYNTGLRVMPTGTNHWRYGVNVGKVTRNRMSRKKLGRLHPKFTGWYIVNGVKYGSSYEAHRATRIPKHTIYRNCKANKKGFSFLPM